MQTGQTTGIFTSKRERGEFKACASQLIEAITKEKEPVKVMNNEAYNLTKEFFTKLTATSLYTKNTDFKSHVDTAKNYIDLLHHAYQTAKKSEKQKSKDKLAESKGGASPDVHKIADFLKNILPAFKKLVDTTDSPALLEEIAVLIKNFKIQEQKNTNDTNENKSENKSTVLSKIIDAGKELKIKMQDENFIINMTKDDYLTVFNFFDQATTILKIPDFRTEILNKWKKLWKKISSTQPEQRERLIAEYYISMDKYTPEQQIKLLSDCKNTAQLILDYFKEKVQGLCHLVNNPKESNALLVNTDMYADLSAAVTGLLHQDLCNAFKNDFPEYTHKAAYQKYWCTLPSPQLLHPRVHPPIFVLRSNISLETTLRYQTALREKGHFTYIDTLRGNQLLVLNAATTYKLSNILDKPKVQLFVKDFKRKFANEPNKRAEGIMLSDNKGILVMMGLNDKEHQQLWQDWFGKSLAESKVTDAKDNNASVKVLPIYAVKAIETVRVGYSTQQQERVKVIKASEMQSEFKLPEQLCESLLIAEDAIETLHSLEQPHSGHRWDFIFMDRAVKDSEDLSHAFSPCHLPDGSRVIFSPHDYVKTPVKENITIRILGGRYERMEAKAESHPNDILILDPKNPKTPIGRFIATDVTCLFERRLAQIDNDMFLSKDDFVFSREITNQVATANTTIHKTDFMGYPIFRVVTVNKIHNNTPLSLPHIKSYYQQHNCLPALYDNEGKLIPPSAYSLKPVAFQFPDGSCEFWQDRNQLYQQAEAQENITVLKGYGKNGCLFKLNPETVLKGLDAHPHAWRIPMTPSKTVYLGYTSKTKDDSHRKTKAFEKGLQKSLQLATKEMPNLLNNVMAFGLNVMGEGFGFDGQNVHLSNANESKDPESICNWVYNGVDRQLWCFAHSVETVTNLAEKLKLAGVRVVLGYSDDKVKKSILIIDQPLTLEIQNKLKAIVPSDVFQLLIELLQKQERESKAEIVLDKTSKTIPLKDLAQVAAASLSQAIKPAGAENHQDVGVDVSSDAAPGSSPKNIR